MRLAIKKSRFEVDQRTGNASKSRLNGSKIKSNGVSKEKTPRKTKTRLYATLDMKFEIYHGKALVDLPIKTVSEANCFEPWRKKYARHKAQQHIVRLGMLPVKDAIKMPCHIQLIRYAPKELDRFDNLPMSLKYVADAVCAIVTGEERAGLADGDKRLSLSCDQVKSDAYGVQVIISWGN